MVIILQVLVFTVMALHSLLLTPQVPILGLTPPLQHPGIIVVVITPEQQLVQEKIQIGNKKN